MKIINRKKFNKKSQTISDINYNLYKLLIEENFSNRNKNQKKVNLKLNLHQSFEDLKEQLIKMKVL